MFEQPDIYPFQRKIEKKNRLSFLEILRKLSIFLDQYLKPIAALYAIAGFLLARAQILGALYPFAVAFIAAQALRERQYAMYSLFGALIALPFTLHGYDMFAQGGVYIILTTLVYFYPAVSRRMIIFPIIAAAINIVVKGMSATFIDGSDYNTMVILFESMLIGGLTPVLYVALRSEAWTKDGEPLTAEEYVCFLLLVMALIMGVGEVSYNFITLKGIISRYCILLAAWFGGPGAGAAIGVLVGMVPSLSSTAAPSLAGSLAFSGLLAGAFKTFNKLGIIIGFILANLLLSIYYLNQPAVLGILVECVIASLLLIMTPYKVYYRLAVLGEEDKAVISKKEEVSLRDMTATHLRDVAELFNDMSHSFNHTACEAKKEDEELNRLFSTINRHVCQDCAIHKICWEHDHVKTCNSILELFKLMDVKGFINIKHINPDIKKRCSRLREMVATISCLYDNYRLDSYWREKIGENRTLFASQLRGMAGIMHKLSSEVNGSIKIKHNIQNNLGRELEKEGLHVDSACVVSYSDKNTEISFEKDACHGLYDCPRIIAKAVSNISGREFAIFDGECSLEKETKKCRFRLVPKGNLRITHAGRQLAKEGSIVTGDTVESAMLKDGKKILLLSDGMGSGVIAAQESQYTVAMLEQLLEAGFDKETALKSINSVLLGRRGREVFSTIDLAVIDLFSGESDFVKIGAPPSFIKRGSKVITLKRDNIPIGVVNTFEVESINEKLKKNDYLVMLTDGVIDIVPAYNKEEWIAERIREFEVETPGELADALLNKVVSAANGKIRDDMTVLVAYIY